MSRINQPLYFGLSILGLCLFYLGFELFFNYYTVITVDEFWFAHSSYHYKDGLPYRDFAPYKTVLGYYFLLLPMLSARGIIETLIFTKNIIAVLNTLVLMGSSWWLSRFFSRASIVTSLAILIFAEIVLSYSTNIRVDLFSYWLCFFSILFLLEKRFLLAGLCIGLGFITSQKALWYIFASDCALASIWLLANKFSARNTSVLIVTLWNILCYNAAILCVIIFYIAFWMWMADWHTVINSMFQEASALYHLDWYDAARKPFWSAIIYYNPLLFALWPLTLISLFVTFDSDDNYPRRVFITIYACVILLCLINYKQVFPYYMQVTIPILFVLYAAFFTWLFAIFQTRKPLRILFIGKTGIWIFMFCYSVMLVFLQDLFQLPSAYLFLCILPFLLGMYLTQKLTISTRDESVIVRLLAITLIFTGSFYPMTSFTAKVINMNGAYQRANLQAMNKLLQDGSDYVAGIELIYNKNQPIAGMRHLMGPAIAYLYTPTEKLRQVMLASLYEDPNVSTDSIIAALKKSAVKCYVNNYRMMALPKKIKDFLAAEYEHYWGSIYLYAPQVASGKQTIWLKFSGIYRIEVAESHGKAAARSVQEYITLNGKTYAADSTPYLVKGKYTSNAHENFRLKLLPEFSIQHLDPNFQKDNWQQFV